jgi:site-specific DNA-cytosine methylase
MREKGSLVKALTIIHITYKLLKSFCSQQEGMKDTAASPADEGMWSSEADEGMWSSEADLHSVLHTVHSSAQNSATATTSKQDNHCWPGHPPNSTNLTRTHSHDNTHTVKQLCTVTHSHAHPTPTPTDTITHSQRGANGGCELR